jgi:exoribonuclease R
MLVAQRLMAKCSDVAMLRAHPPPDDKNMQDLIVTLGELGVHCYHILCYSDDHSYTRLNHKIHVGFIHTL